MMTDESFEELLDDMTHAVYAVGHAGGLWSDLLGAGDDLINICEDLRSRLDWAVEAKIKLEVEVAVVRVLVDARAGWRGVVSDGRRTVSLYDTAPEARAAVERMVDTGSEAEPEVKPPLGTFEVKTMPGLFRGFVEGRAIYTKHLYPSAAKALAAVTRLSDTGNEIER